MPCFYLYKTTNTVNGKYYIGIHKQKTDVWDGYMGSGLLLHIAMEKYGKDNFEFEILEYFDSWEECREAEKFIVNEDFCSRSDTYNISVGGQGGWTTKGYTKAQQVCHKRARSDGMIEYWKTADKHRQTCVEHMRSIRIQPQNKGRVHKGKALNNLRGSINKINKRMRITDGNKTIYLPEGTMYVCPKGWRFGTHISSNFAGHSKETLARMSKMRTGKKYYNNGVENRLFVEGEQPEGWVNGLLRHKKVKTFFITDGNIERRIPVGKEIPEGWSKGRTPRLVEHMRKNWKNQFSKD